MTRSSYQSPSAFRQALTDRLRAKSRDGRWTLMQLQRQMAYDRLLERLYLKDDRWVVKGATALLARGLAVRASIDVDLYLEKDKGEAERLLRQAAPTEIGDWFQFEVGPPQPVAAGTAGVRVPVVAYIGTTEWVKFHVDIVGSDLRMTGEPDAVPPLARGVMPDVEQHGYRAYPLVDHVADKVAATFQRYGTNDLPSTRYRDLVDLVAIVRGASVEAEPQIAALRSEARRRGLAFPARFEVPDRELWERGYAAEARDSLLPIARTLDEALAVVRPFLDPLLAGSAHGRWDPENSRWVI